MDALKQLPSVVGGDNHPQLKADRHFPALQKPSLHIMIRFLRAGFVLAGSLLSLLV